MKHKLILSVNLFTLAISPLFASNVDDVDWHIGGGPNHFQRQEVEFSPDEFIRTWGNVRLLEVGQDGEEPVANSKDLTTLLANIYSITEFSADDLREIADQYNNLEVTEQLFLDSKIRLAFLIIVEAYKQLKKSDAFKDVEMLMRMMSEEIESINKYHVLAATELEGSERHLAYLLQRTRHIEQLNSYRVRYETFRPLLNKVITTEVLQKNLAMVCALLLVPEQKLKELIQSSNRTENSNNHNSSNPNSSTES